MGIRIHKRIKVVPGVIVNLSQSGASVTLKAGPVRWNSRTGRTSVNLPGSFSYRFKTPGIKGVNKSKRKK